MEKIEKENLENEENEILDFYLFKKLMNSGIEKSVCKIELENNIGNKPVYIAGTGFFFNIPSKNLKALLTKNHLINKEFLDNAKK